MSGFPGFASIGALGAGISGLVSILSAAPQRQIGGIIANATVTEEGIDELTTTDHPVEQGANITDHAYKQPARLTIHARWSNSSLEAGADPNYVTDIYNQLLALQVSGAVFTITTGKRLYSNMLMTNLRIDTDEEMETTLDAMMSFKQIIIVQTATSSVPPAANQANPSQTGAPVDFGSQQLTPATISDLGGLF